MREIPFARPIIGEEERDSVCEVLKGHTLVHGPKSHEFEEQFAKFTGAKYATSVSSCTAGLHLAYFYLGLGAGDEVIVPAQTHVATAHAVELCGAKPVFVDAELDSGNIDIAKIESAITKNTKALSIVHYLGMPVDMAEINKIAKRHKLFVVEDCALAIGTKLDGIHAGLHGDIGAFSFYPVKHMTTIEGGMLISKHEEVIKKISRQKAFGVDRTPSERKVAGIYDVTMLGFNYRMNEVEAAVGVEQLKRMPGFLSARERNFAALMEGLAKVDRIHTFASTAGRFESSYYCASIVLDDSIADKRPDIISRLNELGVGTSVYYPAPVPHLSYYADKYGYSRDSFPVAAKISYQSIALPVGPHLDIEDMRQVAECVTKVISNF